MLREDLEKLLTYVEDHASRLNLDIRNAQKAKEKDREQFYEGAKGATQMFHRLVKEILERNDD
jgi:hypothetical protein